MEAHRCGCHEELDYGGPAAPQSAGPGIFPGPAPKRVQLMRAPSVLSCRAIMARKGDS